MGFRGLHGASMKALSPFCRVSWAFMAPHAPDCAFVRLHGLTGHFHDTFIIYSKHGISLVFSKPTTLLVHDTFVVAFMKAAMAL